MKEMKFAIFADLHYWPTHYPQTVPQLEEIMAAAAKENVDFVIHCGDFCHKSPTAPELMAAYRGNPYGLPAYGCLGNHELEDADSLQLVLDAYGMKNNYEYYDRDGFRLIVLDTNYYLTDEGEIKHQEPRTWGCKNGDRLGDEQLQWLRETIQSSENPCILFSHASFEKDCGSPDAARVRQIINEANRQTPGKVLLCCNGHYHRDNLAVQDNVLWFDVNAALNIEWQPRINTLFSEEFINSARMVKNCCFSKDPLYAIVTITTDGHITVKGRKSAFLYDVSPEKLGWPLSGEFQRPCRPYISSGEFQAGAKSAL